MTPGVARRTLLALPVLASLLLACHASACTRVAELPLRLVDGYPVVPGSMAGTPVSFVLDTGAQATLVTPAIADALHLPLRGVTRIYGTGGSQQARVVLLPGLRLGGAAMPEQLAPVSDLPVTLTTDPPLAGLVGATLLARFDLELDVAAGHAALWTPDGCARPPGTTLPLEVSAAGEAFLAVRVNGQALLALIDTGSRATLLTQAAARRLGLDAPASANTAPGVDRGRLPLRHVRARLALGTEPAIDTPLSIAPLQLDRGDLLLGLDILGTRRVWISYARNEVTLGAAR